LEETEQWCFAPVCKPLKKLPCPDGLAFLRGTEFKPAIEILFNSRLEHYSSSGEKQLNPISMVFLRI